MPTAAELRELEDEELETRLAEYRRELLNLRFQLATGQLDNSARVGEVRKDVARVLTVLRDREIALAEGRHAGPVPAVVGPPRPPRQRRSRRVEEDLDEEELEEGALAEDLEDGEAGEELGGVEPEEEPAEEEPEEEPAEEAEHRAGDRSLEELSVEGEELVEEAEAEEDLEEQAEAPRRGGRLRRRRGRASRSAEEPVEEDGAPTEDEEEQ